jgi:hypothetical protein
MEGERELREERREERDERERERERETRTPVNCPFIPLILQSTECARQSHT